MHAGCTPGRAAIVHTCAWQSIAKAPHGSMLLSNRCVSSAANAARSADPELQRIWNVLSVLLPSAITPARMVEGNVVRALRVVSRLFYFSVKPFGHGNVQNRTANLNPTT